MCSLENMDAFVCLCRDSGGNHQCVLWKTWMPLCAYARMPLCVYAFCHNFRQKMQMLSCLHLSFTADEAPHLHLQFGEFKNSGSVNIEHRPSASPST